MMRAGSATNGRDPSCLGSGVRVLAGKGVPACLFLLGRFRQQLAPTKFELFLLSFLLEWEVFSASPLLG